MHFYCFPCSHWYRFFKIGPITWEDQRTGEGYLKRKLTQGREDLAFLGYTLNNAHKQISHDLHYSEIYTQMFFSVHDCGCSRFSCQKNETFQRNEASDFIFFFLILMSGFSVPRRKGCMTKDIGDPRPISSYNT